MSPAALPAAAPPGAVVARSRERIEQAKEDWREGRFGEIPDETETLPPPEW